MKIAFLVLLLVTTIVCFSQKDTIASTVYKWTALTPSEQNGRGKRQIAEGSGAALAHMEWHVTALAPGQSPHAPHKHEEEELIIIKEGQLQVTIEDSSKILGPRSIALFLPGDQHGLSNAGTTNATYFVFRYRSKSPANSQRAKEAGGSFMIDFNNVSFTPHDKGGVRKYIERPTAMLKRFEMHVTTLNAGIKSHEPHTHLAEENVLLVKGTTAMQIADSFQNASDGDLIYLSSNIPHAIKNIGKEPAMYFAFQWE